MAKESVELSEVEVSFLGIKGKWVADRAQMDAAWEMYVELVTRVAVQALAPGTGLLREALSSLHSLFGETRRILKAHGPGVARPLHPTALSFGIVAVDVLNQVLRPLLSRWHAQLQAYEATRGSGTSPLDHESKWEHAPALRAELERVRNQLSAYADLLAKAAGVPALHERPADARP